MDIILHPVRWALAPLSLRIMVPVCSALVAFVIYWFTYQSSNLYNFYDQRYDADTAAEKFTFSVKLFGGIIMGVFPLCICLWLFQDSSLGDYGLVIQRQYFPISFISFIALAIPLGGISFYVATKPNHWKRYPQMKVTVWTRRAKWKNGFAWLVFLCGYDALFRGVLLFGLWGEIGMWPAVTISTVMYSAFHLPKGFQETVGSAILSLIFCAISIICNNIWPATLVHVLMACISFLTVIKYNPKLSSSPS